MRKLKGALIFLILVLAENVSGEKAPECIKNGIKYGVTKGSFRAEWWNYQERGMSYLDGGCYEPALKDIEEAIRLRTALVKKDCDQRRARTYGMHFVDYFGHRERGIALYHLGQLDNAEKELEFSLSCVESSKAQYYLDLVRKAKLEASQEDKLLPELEIIAPKDKSYLKQNKVKVSGRAWDDSFVKEVWLGSEPIVIPISEKEIQFQQELELNPGWNNFQIRVVDLTGKEQSKSYSLFLDQEGPEVSFLEIKQISGAELEVRGEIWDEGGVVKLILNNKESAITEGQFYNRIKLTTDSKIWFKAIDQAGNETEGVVNLIMPTPEPKGARLEKPYTHQYARLIPPEKIYFFLPPMMAFLQLGKRETPFLGQTLNLAEIGTQEPSIHLAFSEFYWNLKEKYESYIDNEPPQIKLKGFKGEHTVYFPEIYLEGLVTDQSPITELTINGKRIGKTQARNLFFNQIIPLSVGANRIIIQAKDQKGNVAEKTILVSRLMPVVHQISERMVVSMLPFYECGPSREIGSVAYDNLISAIVSQQRFNFVDRAKVEAIVRELRLSAEQLIDPNYTLKVGKMTSAEAMILGFVKETPNSIEIYSQLVDVETGEILTEKDAYNQDKSLSALKYLTRGLAIRLREDFPIQEGNVVKMDGKNVVLNLGSSQKIKPGMRVIFFSEKEIIDAETGLSLGYTTDKIGKGRIVAVYERMSSAEPFEKIAGITPDKKVITK